MESMIIGIFLVILGVPTAIYYTILCLEKAREHGADRIPGRISSAWHFSTWNPAGKYHAWRILALAHPDRRQGFYAFSLCGLIIAQHFALVFGMYYYYVLSKAAWTWLDYVQSVVALIGVTATSALIGVFLFGIRNVSLNNVVLDQEKQV